MYNLCSYFSCVFSKFDVTPTLEHHFLSRCEGGRAVQDITMTDTYFDDCSTYTLTSNDLWLRKRDSFFELKWPKCIPNVGSSHCPPSPVLAVYNESSSWEVICTAIKQHANFDLGVPPNNSCSESFTSWLQENNFFPFAIIETNRIRYPIDIFLPHFKLSLKVNVDIDKVRYKVDKDEGDDTAPPPAKCYEYDLGEVEILSCLPAEVDPAAVMVAVLRDLGILPPEDENGSSCSYSPGSTGTDTTGTAAAAGKMEGDGECLPLLLLPARRGKVEEFLLRFRPAHHQRLFGIHPGNNKEK